MPIPRILEYLRRDDRCEQRRLLKIYQTHIEYGDIACHLFLHHGVEHRHIGAAQFILEFQQAVLHRPCHL